MKEIIKKIGVGLATMAGVVLMAGTVATPTVMAADYNLEGGVTSGQGEGTPSTLLGKDNSIVNTIINTMLFIVGLLSVVMIIFAGIRYVTAHGDKNQVESAKNTLIYAIVGLIIAIVAYALVSWVTSLWGNN